MAKEKVKRIKQVYVKGDDVVVSLSGTVFVEGSVGTKIAKAISEDRRSKIDVLVMLRKHVPELSTKQITVDPLGRVRINSPKIAAMARRLADQDPLTGPKVRKILGVRKNKVTGGRAYSAAPTGAIAAATVISELNVFCAGTDGAIVDVACGTWDVPPGDDKDVNYGCNW